MAFLSPEDPGSYAGKPARWQHPDHQPRVPLQGGALPWCKCGWKPTGRLGDPILADHLNETVRQSWTTTQLQEDFEVVGFQAPFVVVIRKADRVKGSLQFDHTPRIYYNFEPVQ